MTTPAMNEAVHLDEDATGPSRLWQDLLVGIGTQSWLASLVIHSAIFIVLALTLGTIQIVNQVVNAPAFDAAEEVAQVDIELERVALDYVPPDPSVLDDESLRQTESPQVQEQFHDDSPEFSARGNSTSAVAIGPGGMGGFEAISRSLGPMIGRSTGLPGNGGGLRPGDGKGGGNNGLVDRGHRKAVAIGPTKASERAVTGALNWLARHQNPAGSWSLDHQSCCKGGLCSGAGEVKSDAGATALALLPFLAAGQTHQTRCLYQKNIQAGLNWLIENQRPSGDLSAGSASQMYTHGLATIALCEAYGMTQDSRVGYAAQAAINFIQSGQNQQGSWRYTHGSDDSDTSVFGWQVMALKSGQMAGLQVKPDAMERSRRFLDLVATGGRYKELFGYTPGGGPTLSMTSVGLLTTQYLGAGRDDPKISGGVEYLSKNLPDIERRNVYYWYYATQVMHNVPGAEWDNWNRAVRRVLITTQATSGCETGSWDPERPASDPWGRQGGRLMCTSLSCLTLEVYYRYLPLYKADAKDVERDLNKLGPEAPE